MALSDFDNLQDTEQPQTASAPMEQTPYEREFLPTQSKFFDRLASNPKIDPYIASGILRENRLLAQKDFMQRAAVEQAGMDIKARQMQFESAKFTLDQAREEAARKRDMFTGLSQLQSELNPIMSDPNLDSSQRKQAYGQLGVKYAGQAALNPAIANALNAANSSLTNQPKDRVSKLDYFNAGADPNVLAQYESTLGRSLAANEDVPVDVYGAGLYAGKELKRSEEIKARMGMEALQQKQAGINTVLDTVIKGKLEKNPMDPMKPSNIFDSPATEQAALETVTQFGTPEEQQLFQKGTAIDKLNIGQGIAIGIKSGRRLAAPPKPTGFNFRSPFTSPK